MSFAYFTSGERDDDEGEGKYVIPKDWKSYEHQSQQIDDKKLDNKKPTIVLPIEFDDEYYKDKLSGCKTERDEWDWKKTRAFMYSTLDFLKSSFQEFVKKFNIDISEQQIPAFLLLKTKKTLSENVAEQDKREAELSQQFSYKSNRTFITNKVNRHKRLNCLVEDAKLAWGYFYAICGYYPVAQAISINAFNQKTSPSTDEIIQAYALCEKAGYHILKLDKQITSSNMDYYKFKSRSSSIYADATMLQLFDKVMSSIDLPDSTIFESTISKLSPKLTEIGENNPLDKRVIAFYSCYTFMRRLIWRMKCINNIKKEGGNNSYIDDERKLFNTPEPTDMFVKSKQYLQHCSALLQDLPNNHPAYKDVADILSRFDAVINEAEQYQEDYDFDMDKINELLKKYLDK